MATHPAAIRQSICNFVVDKLDVGSGARATLDFLTSTDVPVATVQMAVKATGAFGNADSNGKATANAMTADADADGGVIAKYALKDCNGAIVIQGPVTGIGGGGDIELVSLIVTAHQTFTINTLTYTAPP
jgi:hypothetical protein